jgi:hypothetical protein
MKGVAMCTYLTHMHIFFNLDVSPNRKTMDLRAHSLGLQTLNMHRYTHSRSHRHHLPPTHLQDRDQSVDLARLVVDATLAPDSATALCASIIRRLSPRPRWDAVVPLGERRPMRYPSIARRLCSSPLSALAAMRSAAPVLLFTLWARFLHGSHVPTSRGCRMTTMRPCISD